jgi:hypothetical protein
MPDNSKEKQVLFVATVGLVAWLIPGAGYYMLNDVKRCILVGVTIVLTFSVGVYIGSIGVIDKIHHKPWYVAQVMNSPVVFLLGNHVASTAHQSEMDRIENQNDPTQTYTVYARQAEIGQIYTSIAGLLNLLCIVNVVYIAYTRQTPESGG